MTSIRTYEGEIRICTRCGQPAFLGGISERTGEWWLHFTEQYDGVHCNRFPLAGPVRKIPWDFKSRQHVKERYPDLRPRR
ncbi:hypothetical protein DN069_21445 [Streptacidiphilus pinicola]|uniref:Uncharacterized protein n=1 Tax=Streptacidiphilus pinicola TaxID=2219663 RepID=A0A2X0IIW2_9ACTN|nr:hypothetical protein [Streptacidiphilus pinicola]RAG83563.1 hypothetical protein DN069_21445 [Streptacidiphilus pinicola]